MDEKNVWYSNRSPRRMQKRRRKQFPWEIMFALIAVVAAFLFVFVTAIDQLSELTALPPGESAAGAPSTWDETPTDDPAEGSPAVADDTDWNLVLVNYENPIPENYEPDLVEVTGGEKVDRRIYDPLMEMLEAAKEGNWDQLPMVVSGYRTQEKQQSLYDDKVKKYEKQGYSKEEAKEMAEQWVAVPGYSEHQIGLAVDINGATYDVYLWLQANSYKYGFIFRYPGYKTDLTGVAEEVWHYRYVGVEAATEMYEQGLCLEEYLAERQGENET